MERLHTNLVSKEELGPRIRSMKPINTVSMKGLGQQQKQKN